MADRSALARVVPLTAPLVVWTIALACNSVSGIGKYHECATCFDSGSEAIEGSRDDSLDGPAMDVPADLGPDAACGELTPDAKEVWVDKASTRKESVGTYSCPYKSILEATTRTFAGPVTITVRAGDYAETATDGAPIRLRSGMTLFAIDGQDKTKLGGPGGTCAEGTCTVWMEGSSALNGFTVGTTAAGPTADAVYVSSLVETPKIGRVRVVDAPRDGIRSNGNVRLDDVVASGNKGAGVYVANGKLTVAGLSGRFEKSEVGIYVDSGATLLFSGGLVTGNTSMGVRLVGGAHEIVQMTAVNNLGTGLNVSTGATARVRASVFVGNSVGVVVRNSAGSSADLGGLAGSLGNNKFSLGSAAGAGYRNVVAALCFGSAAPGSIEYEGNTFTECPPKTFDGTCFFPDGGVDDAAVYREILYLSSDAGTPLKDPTTCTSAP